MKPFTSIDDATVSLAASTTSARVALKQAFNGLVQLRIHNAGPDLAFIRKGGADVEASADDLPIPAGALEVISLDAGPAVVSHLAAITASGAATLYFTPGQGI